MCPWVGSHAPSCGRQLWGLPSCVEYLSPQGVLLPRVYGNVVSPLWLELRGLAAWQATPSWDVCRHACHELLPWLRVMFAVVPDAAWPGSDQWPWSTAPATGPVGASDPGGVDRCLLSLSAPSVRVRVRCPGPLGACSPVRTLFVFPARCPGLVHRCARCVRYACAVGGFVGEPPLSFFLFFSFFVLRALFFFPPLSVFFLN